MTRISSDLTCFVGSSHYKSKVQELGILALLYLFHLPQLFKIPFDPLFLYKGLYNFHSDVRVQVRSCVPSPLESINRAPGTGRKRGAPQLSFASFDPHPQPTCNVLFPTALTSFMYQSFSLCYIGGVFISFHFKWHRFLLVGWFGFVLSMCFL